MANPLQPDPKGPTRLLDWSSTPGGASGGISRINTLADISGVNHIKDPVVVVRGRIFVDDGLGGVWEYRSGSTSTPDGYLVISSVDGNWHKVV